MSNQLQTNLDAILQDKNTNLLPENLKAGVTCLGIEGTYEGSGSTTEGIKQFSTIEEMQADTTAKEGDLAVVYRSEVQNATVDSKFQVATFPETVVLDSAITDYVDIRYRAVDSSVMFNCRGSLDSSGFRMDCFAESGQIRIQYTSSDGITYTRTDTTGNPVDFGTEIYYERTEMWNDAIGKFIQVGGNKFEGLYKYALNFINDDVINFVSMSSITFDYNPTATNQITNVKFGYSENKYSVTKINNCLNKMNTDGLFSGSWAGYVYEGTDGNLYAYNNSGSQGIGYDDNKNLLGFVKSGKTAINTYKLNLETGTYESSEPIAFGSNTLKYSGAVYNVSNANNMNSIPIRYAPGSNTITPANTSIDVYCGNSSTAYYQGKSVDCRISENKYILAPTQLNATSDHVYEKEFYGKNGVESGTLQNKENLTIKQVQEKVTIWNNFNEGIICPSDMISAFTNYTNLKTIPLLGTSNVTIMEGMFVGCTSLTAIPLIDTSNVKIMTNTFRNCTNLTTIPLLNTSSVTNINSMFYGCPNLSDESLNNILAMCTNATKITSNKTLKYIGLTSEQANKCKTLSNYSAFTSAGWTTGY